MKLIKQCNLGGFNVGIIDGSDLCSTSLRLLHVARYTYRFRHLRNNKGITLAIGGTIVLVLLLRGMYDAHQSDGLSDMIYTYLVS